MFEVFLDVRGVDDVEILLSAVLTALNINDSFLSEWLPWRLDLDKLFRTVQHRVDDRTTK